MTGRGCIWVDFAGVVALGQVCVLNKRVHSRSLSSIHILYNHSPTARLRPHPLSCAVDLHTLCEKQIMPNAQTTEPEVVERLLACEPPRRRGARWACSAHSPFTWPAPARPAPHWSTHSDRARGGSAIWNHGHETSQRTFCPYLAISCTQHHHHL